MPTRPAENYPSSTLLVIGGIRAGYFVLYSSTIRCGMGRRCMVRRGPRLFCRCGLMDGSNYIALKGGVRWVLTLALDVCVEVDIILYSPSIVLDVVKT